MFGYPQCNLQGNCPNEKVLQYDPDTNRWEELGNLEMPRSYHEVVEIPGYFCDILENMATTQQPTTEPTFEIPPLESLRTAALIVGGVDVFDVADRGNANVELFGCPDATEVSVRIEDYPSTAVLPGGTFIHDEELGDFALVCGGDLCNQEGDLTVCNISDKCYAWYPNDNSWTNVSSLTTERWKHIFARTRDLDNPTSDELRLMTIGGSATTEIYNEEDGRWQFYRNLTFPSWESRNCLVQSGSKIIYMSNDDVYEINLAKPTDGDTFEAELVSQLPPNLEVPGKCAVLTIDGYAGE